VFIDRYIIMTVTWKAVFMHGAVDDATLLQINFQTSFSAVSNLRADPYKKNLELTYVDYSRGPPIYVVYYSWFYLVRRPPYI
jgi:hypothetical protein